MDASTPVLYVEDDPLDVENVRRAFQRLGIVNPLLTARNGREALDLLRGEAGNDAPLPGLILLDLRMPVMGGLEFLAERARDARLGPIPVVVLSCADQEAERQQARRLGAADDLVKPTRFEDFVTVVAHVQRRWLAPAPA